MKTNLEGQSKKILKVCLWMNVVLLVVLFFYSSKKLFITGTIINIILLGSYFILEKYAPLFEAMVGSRKSSRILDNALGRLNG